MGGHQPADFNEAKIYLFLKGVDCTFAWSFETANRIRETTQVRRA